jgi:cation transport ATPase
MLRVISTGFLYLFLLGTVWMHLHWSAALLLSLLVASSWLRSLASDMASRRVRESADRIRKIGERL